MSTVSETVGFETAKRLMHDELQKAKEATEVVKTVQEYVDWYMQQVRRDRSPVEATNLVIEHTKVWGVAQLVAHELDSIDKALAETIPHGRFSKPSEGAMMKAMTLRTVMLSKLLYELFVKDTNYADKE